jgi:hypothetical protein
MKNFNKNTRLPVSKKIGKVIPGSSRYHKMPTEKSWQKCISNLQFLLSNDSCEDENLNIDDQIKKTKQELFNLKPFPALFFQVINIVTEKKRTLENKLIQLNETAEINSEDLNFTINSNSITGMKRIPIDGKSYDFAIKAGIFFFNPNYKNGLHLSKVYLEFITGLLCEIFYHSKGKAFGYRYIYANILV